MAAPSPPPEAQPQAGGSKDTPPRPPARWWAGPGSLGRPAVCSVGPPPSLSGGRGAMHMASPEWEGGVWPALLRQTPGLGANHRLLGFVAQGQGPAAGLSPQRRPQEGTRGRPEAAVAGPCGGITATSPPATGPRRPGRQQHQKEPPGAPRPPSSPAWGSPAPRPHLPGPPPLHTPVGCGSGARYDGPNGNGEHAGEGACRSGGRGGSSEVALRPPHGVDGPWRVTPDKDCDRALSGGGPARLLGRPGGLSARRWGARPPPGP